MLSQHPHRGTIVQTFFQHIPGSVLIACPIAWWNTLFWLEVTECGHHLIHCPISNGCRVNPVRSHFLVKSQVSFLYPLCFSLFPKMAVGTKENLKMMKGQIYGQCNMAIGRVFGSVFIQCGSARQSLMSLFSSPFYEMFSSWKRVIIAFLLQSGTH